MSLPRSVAILVVSLTLLAGCGEPEDKTPWIMWNKMSSEKVMGLDAKWKPMQSCSGRAKCEGALGKFGSSNDEWLQEYACWPTGTTPQ